MKMVMARSHECCGNAGRRGPYWEVDPAAVIRLRSRRGRLKVLGIRGETEKCGRELKANIAPMVSTSIPQKFGGSTGRIESHPPAAKCKNFSGA